MAFTPYELVFGRRPNVPSTFTKESEHQYNYDSYMFGLKWIMQETYKVAKDNLIKKKTTKSCTIKEITQENSM